MLSVMRDIKQEKYYFDSFSLLSNEGLFYDNDRVTLPPKEFGILCLLVKYRGCIVTKDEIIEKVWKGGIVSDESLTRCIYALRRVLNRYKNTKFIETVYGKGYRFTVPVLQDKTSGEKKTFELAIFPFETADTCNPELLHNILNQALYKYKFTGVNVLSPTLTSTCNNTNAINEFLYSFTPDYYLTGRMIQNENSEDLVIELNEGRGHKVCGYLCLEYNKNNPLSDILSKIIIFLLDKIPVMNVNCVTESTDLDVAMLCIKAKTEILKYTPSSLKKAKQLLKLCLEETKLYHLPFCYLAETYILLAQIGLCPHEKASSKAKELLEQAYQLSPANHLILGLMGLLNGLDGDYLTASALLNQARLLMPDSADLLFYQSCVCLFKGDSVEGKQYLRKCISLDRDRMPALCHLLWLKYCTDDLDDITNDIGFIGNEQICNHPLFQSLIALILVMNQKMRKAEEIINKIEQSEAQGYIYVNLLYVKYMIYGEIVKDEIVWFLESNDTSIPNSCMLPLVLAAYGKATFFKEWENLKRTDYLWSKINSCDPRILAQTPD